jgi:DNA-binding Lrp family transcriptional regulator
LTTSPFSQQQTSQLDELDIAIFRELGNPGSPQWNVRESFAHISRKLGVDEETIRLRVSRAKKRGLLPQWQMIVNPHLLGCEAASLATDVADEGKKSKAVSQIGLVEGVIKMLDLRGRGLMITMYYENDDSLSRKVKLIESLCESPPSALWKSVFPQSNIRMKKMDWRIVYAMREDARKDLNKVASQLVLSTRTIQRRLSVMSKGRAIYLLGAPPIGRVRGLICKFLVFCSNNQKKRAADRAVASIGRVGFSDTSPEQYTNLGLACHNLAEADSITRKLKDLYDVQTVKMDIVNEFITVREWLDNEIRVRSNGATAASPAATLRAK